MAAILIVENEFDLLQVLCKAVAEAGAVERGRKLLLVTGHPSTTELLEHGGTAYLRRSFRPDDLVRIIN
jgi:hypothetical protein